MNSAIPSAEAVRAALAPLSLKQLEKLAELSGVPFTTIYKVGWGGQRPGSRRCGSSCLTFKTPWQLESAALDRKDVRFNAAARAGISGATGKRWEGWQLMPYTPEHFGDGRSQFRLDRSLLRPSTPCRRLRCSELIPVPEATESDWAAFDELRGSNDIRLLWVTMNSPCWFSSSQRRLGANSPGCFPGAPDRPSASSVEAAHPQDARDAQAMRVNNHGAKSWSPEDMDLLRRLWTTAPIEEVREGIPYAFEPRA